MKFFLSSLLAGGICVGTLTASEITTYISNLNSPDYTVRQSARLEMRQTLVDASGAKLRGYEQELIAAIGADRDFATRDWSIRMLELVGNSASVNPLTTLLDDPDPRIRDLALRALSAIPSTSADNALEKAILEVPPSQRAGYVDALAYRGKPRARNELDDLLFNGSSEAALALGKIGSRSSRAALWEAHASANNPNKHDIELALIDAGITDRNRAASLARTGQSPAIRVAAYEQLLKLDSNEAWERLNEILRDSANVNRRVALRMAMQSSLADDVVSLLPNLNTPEQVVVLGSIADRRLSQFENAVLPLLGNVTAEVNEHVIRTLGIVGSDASYQPLLDLYLANPRDRVTSAALARLNAPSVDRKLITAVNGTGSTADRAAALQLLVLRNSDGVLDIVNRLGLPGNDPAIREEAFRGMEVIGNTASVELLLSIVLSDDPDKRQAQGSLKKLSANLAVPDYLWKDFYAPALAAAESDALRRDVLVILDGNSGAEAADYLADLILTGHDLRPDALRALQRWTDISGGDVWLKIERDPNASEREKISARTSIVRLLKSNRVTGNDNQRIDLAKRSILQIPDAEFQQSILDIYSKRIQWGIKGQLLRQFPELVDHPNVLVDVAAFLEKIE
ncbi:MAG: hypothetical protein SynsKO_31240 [Synoicihabitans sp.]